MHLQAEEIKNNNEDHNVSYRGQIKVVSEERVKLKKNLMMDIILKAFDKKSGINREKMQDA